MLKKLLKATAVLVALVSSGPLFGQAGDYAFSTSTSTYTPLGGSATAVDILADTRSDTVAIGFDFYFEGVAYDSASVASDGFLSFVVGASSTLSNDLDNGSGVRRPLVAPLWDDHDGQANTSAAAYEVTGVAPNRIFTFEWRDWEWSYNSTDSVVSFQVKLYETTNIIEFHYRWECASCITSPDASIGLSGASTFLSVTDINTGTPTASNTTENSSIDTVVSNQVFSFTPPACASPGNVTYTNVKSDSITVNWSAAGSGPWYIYWGPCGFDQASSGVNIDTSTTLDFIAHGLSHSSSYEFKVFEDCGTNGLSDTTDGGCVNTTCLTQSLPYSENFSANLGCMTVTQNGGTTADTWEWVLDYPDLFSGPQTIDGNPGFAFVDSDGAGSGVDMDEILESPEIDASGITGALVLEFDQYYRNLGDTASVDVWDGSQWVNVLKQSASAGLFGNPDFQSIDISAYANANLKVRFHYYEANWAWYWGIDNLLVHEVSCQPSSNLVAYAASSDSIAVTWNPGAGVSYGVEYGPAGFTPGTGTGISTTDTFAIANGLTTQTLYDFYVYDTCAAGNSFPLGPLTVSTSCTKQVLPYNETFDTDLGCFVVTQNGGTSNDTWNWVSEYNSFSGTQTLDNDTGFAFVDSDGAGIGVDMDEILESPAIDASGLPGTTALILEFDQYYDALGDTAAVDVWDGTQWVNILKQSSDIGAFGNPDHQFIDVTAHANADFKVRFHYYNANWAYYWAVDNFSVSTLPCGIASALDTGVVTPNSAVLKWSSNGSLWNVLWGPPGFNQASGSGNKITGVSTNPYTLTGLGADSCYSFYVQDTCSGIGSGPWVGPFTFCTPPTCPAPTNLGVIVSSIATNSADIYWTSGGATNFNIEYGPVGFVKGTGSRMQVTNDTTTLSSLNSATSYEFYVRDSCSATDTSKWTGPVSFTTLCNQFVAPYVQNFDAADWIADDADFSAANSQIGLCWERTPNSGSQFSWRVRSTATGSSSTGPSGDTTGGSYVYTESSNGLSGDSTQLISPLIDLSNLSTPIMTFAYHFYGSNINKMYVAVSAGSGWVTVDSIIGSQQSSSTAPWIGDTVDLAGYMNQSIRIAFIGISGGCCTGDLALDAFYVGDPVTCLSPTSVAVANASCDSVEVSWTSDAISTSSYIEYGAKGFAFGSGTVIANATSPQTISGLMLDTEYDVYVVDSCSMDQSNPSSVATFKTDSVGPVLASFTNVQTSTTLADALVDFDGSGSTGDGLTYVWDFDNGSTGTGMNAQGTYTTNGTYNVMLTVTDRCGNTDDTTIVITVAGISIVENEYNAGIEMYPNPNKGTFNVNVTDGSGAYTIEVVDLSGRVIYQQGDITPGTAHKVELQNKAKGVYMVRLKGEGLNVTQRIVID